MACLVTFLSRRRVVMGSSPIWGSLLDSYRPRTQRGFEAASIILPMIPIGFDAVVCSRCKAVPYLPNYQLISVWVQVHSNGSGLHRHLYFSWPSWLWSQLLTKKDKMCVFMLFKKHSSRGQNGKPGIRLPITAIRKAIDQPCASQSRRRPFMSLRTHAHSSHLISVVLVPIHTSCRPH